MLFDDFLSSEKVQDTLNWMVRNGYAERLPDGTYQNTDKGRAAIAGAENPYSVEKDRTWESYLEQALLEAKIAKAESQPVQDGAQSEE